MKNKQNATMWNKSREFNNYGFNIVKKHDLSYKWDLHWHNSWEIEIVINGNGYQFMNGIKHEISPGAVYILNPTDFHEVDINELDVYNISFSDDLLSEEFITAFSGSGGGRTKHLSEEKLSQLTSICEMLLYEYNNSPKFSDKTTRCLLDLLFIHLLRNFDIEKTKNSDTKKTMINNAVSYINIHFRENPTLSDVASNLGITPNYLSEQFHLITGKKYKEYLNDVRLIYAKKLLASSNLSVTEICFASGFSSLSNFLRVFKERFGMSPQSMQKQL